MAGVIESFTKIAAGYFAGVLTYKRGPMKSLEDHMNGRGALFAILMSTLFLPQVVLNVPQFILFTKLGWVDSKLYLPLIVPTMFATDTYFVFMLVQFMRNIPKELEEAAKIDGCNVVQTLISVIVPMLMRNSFHELVLRHKENNERRDDRNQRGCQNTVPLKTVIRIHRKFYKNCRRSAESDF